MTKSKKNIIPDSEIAFNNLPFLPPNKDKIETVKVLRQLVKSSGVCKQINSSTRFDSFLAADG
jgi:hypothetical protein